MDCMMPVMDGFEATQAIRLLLPREMCTIVALSAMTHQDEAQKAFKSGMDEFRKSFLLFTLILVAKPPELIKIKDLLERTFKHQ